MNLQLVLMHKAVGNRYRPIGFRRPFLRKTAQFNPCFPEPWQKEGGSVFPLIEYRFSVLLRSHTRQAFELL